MQEKSIFPLSIWKEEKINLYQTESWIVSVAKWAPKSFNWVLIGAFEVIPDLLSTPGCTDVVGWRGDCTDPAPVAEREAGWPVQLHPINKVQLLDKTIKSQGRIPVIRNSKIWTQSVMLFFMKQVCQTNPSALSDEITPLVGKIIGVSVHISFSQCLTRYHSTLIRVSTAQSKWNIFNILRAGQPTDHGLTCEQGKAELGTILKPKTQILATGVDGISQGKWAVTSSSYGNMTLRAHQK